MALIKCPECGKEISDKAEACPHCGISFKTENNRAVNKYETVLCPYCKKTYVKLKDSGDGCPYCGKPAVEKASESKSPIPEKLKEPEKPKDFKELGVLKNLFELKKGVLLIGILVICVCLLGIILLSKHFKNVEEQKLYERVLKAQEIIVNEYGDNIEPLQAIYFYRDMEKFPPDEEFSYDYDTGYYIYFSYDMNPGGVKDKKEFIWHDGELLFNDAIPQNMFTEINIRLRELYLMEFLMLMGGSPSTTIEEVNNQVNGSCEIDTDILKKYIGVAIDE